MKKKQKIIVGEPKDAIPFSNNKGDRINIPRNYKIEDLLRMGITEIRLERKGSFLPDGWYGNVKPRNKQNNKQKNKKGK